MLRAFFKSKSHDFNLVKGDCVKVLSELDFKFDMIFADPPYFLSNGGISVQSGKQVSVNGINRKGLKKIMNLIVSGFLSVERS